MTEIDSVEINKMIIHKIGSPTRDEDLKLSAGPLKFNDTEITDVLIKYFLNPFNENEQYSFKHLSDVNLNEVFTYVSKIFEDENEFKRQSEFLARFLYKKSVHPKIKSGELYIVHFKNIFFEDEYNEAIGLFKSESKETFLKVFSKGKNWELSKDIGININRLDKGCLIFKKNKEAGYISLIVDNINKNEGAEYWVNEFLQVNPFSNNYSQTNNMLGMYKQFIKSEATSQFELTKTDQIDMLSRSIEYFRKNEQFHFQEFAEEVIHYPDVLDAFNNYKVHLETDKGLNFNEPFEIHQLAVKKQERNYKSILKLDKNFHIYIHGNKELIEKGYDEKMKMNYYKVYFKEEN